MNIFKQQDNFYKNSGILYSIILLLPIFDILDGYTYPSGGNVVIPIYHMGRDAEMFDNPEEFCPERFLTETSAETLNPFGYIPFSAGPRNCIGQRFAQLELKSVLSKILRHFEVTLAADSVGSPSVMAELTLVPASKIHFYFQPRIY